MKRENQPAAKPLEKRPLIPAKLPMTIKTLTVVSALILFSTCAPSVTAPPQPPLNRLEMNAVVTAISSQDKATHALFSTGSISVKGRNGELDATVLIAAKKDPDRIKIEITHPWGRPLAHILIDSSALRVLSFNEKRVYSGHLGDPIFPSIFTLPFNRAILWSTIRAYPVLPPHYRVVSEAGPWLVFLTREGEKSVAIRMGSGDSRPQSMIFPPQGTRITYANFQNRGEKIFARKTELSDKEGNTLILELKTMVFNEPIPKEVFTLAVPADFTKKPRSDERGL